MPILNQYQRVLLSRIKTSRETRQRQADLETDDLEPSILARGVIQPILIEKIDDPDFDYLLIAGERRHLASTKIGLKDIPARFVKDLTPLERRILELEENVKRKNLHWKDEVRAVREIHMDFVELNGKEWTQEQTAEGIGYSPSTLSIQIRVAEELAAGNKLVEQAAGFRPAYNTITRGDERRIGDVMNDLLEDRPIEPVPTTIAEAAGVASIGEALAHVKAQIADVMSSKPITTTAVFPESILNTSFLDWAPTYSGKPFNFLHCDFPYGINLDKSEQAQTHAWESYADDEKLFFSLCKCLCSNLDRLMTQSGHMMFWLQSENEFVSKVLTFFRQNAPSLEFVELPLIWHKTDNRGILSDPKRRARHIYESCLYASRGDRPIIKSVSDVYGAPTSKEIHQSEKPEPMLRYFMQMFVDETTRMLDPTCGSATSLRSAESLGAAQVFGLEINSEFCEAARTALRKSRNLRALERATHGKNKNPQAAAQTAQAPTGK